MSDPQLLRLREEYRRLEMLKSEVETAVRLLENRLPLVSKCLATLERGERPPDVIIEALSLTSTSNLTLFYKALGLRKQTEASLMEKKAELQNTVSKLESLTVCPRCSGLGTKSSGTRYERMQEGMIVPMSSVSNCDLCLGSGKLILSGE